jgi:hypothetical protein
VTNCSYKWRALSLFMGAFDANARTSSDALQLPRCVSSRSKCATHRRRRLVFAFPRAVRRGVATKGCPLPKAGSRVCAPKTRASVRDRRSRASTFHGMSLGDVPHAPPTLHHSLTTPRPLFHLSVPPVLTRRHASLHPLKTIVLVFSAQG